jgi:hypothetical protein
MTEILSDEAVAFVAVKLFERVALADEFPDFLTTVAYDSID